MGCIHFWKGARAKNSGNAVIIAINVFGIHSFSDVNTTPDHRIFYRINTDHDSFSDLQGNGFQVLIKSGLLPEGKIGAVRENSDTLFRNQIGRHISQIVTTKLISNKSPWLQELSVGEEYEIAVSHGEGRIEFSGGIRDYRILTASSRSCTPGRTDTGRPSRTDCPPHGQ